MVWRHVQDPTTQWIPPETIQHTHEYQQQDTGYLNSKLLGTPYIGYVAAAVSYYYYTDMALPYLHGQHVHSTLFFHYTSTVMETTVDICGHW